jgi:hypothetical protein
VENLKKKGMNLVTKIRDRIFLATVFIVNRFNSKISIKWRVIILITIFKLTVALLIVEKGTKSVYLTFRTGKALSKEWRE